MPKLIDKEKDKETGLSNFGVRNYDDGIGRFMSIDPKWEKYPSFTPYHYSVNNPLNYADPSGEEFVFVEGTSDEFIAQFYEALAYLEQSETGRELIAKLDAPGIIVNVAETQEGSKYSINTNTVKWNPYEGGVPIYNGNTASGAQTPAMGLIHEMGHADAHLTNPKQAQKDMRTDNPKYGDEHERKVIENVENRVAGELNRAMGMIVEIPRYNHDLETYRTTGPTTTKPADKYGD